MATRSNIGIVNEDGSVTGIYVHWDGYPSHVGRILLTNYNTNDLVNKLIGGGNISSIGENTDTDLPHSFDKPVAGVCVYYNRDRGESGNEPEKFVSLTEFQMHGHDSGADYQYLFENGKWMYRKHDGTWNELTARVCKCD